MILVDFSMGFLLSQFWITSFEIWHKEISKCLWHEVKKPAVDILTDLTEAKRGQWVN